MPALASIRRATKRFLEPEPDHIVELAVLPSFGMRWLAPRLPGLTWQHPDLVVNISARTDIFDFAREPFHAAIHVGGPDWPEANHDLLFHEDVVPVVAPALLARHPITAPEDLLGIPLLVQSQRKEAWAQWFALFGMAAPAPEKLPSYSHFMMLAQSVKAGGGAALLPTFLIAPELEAGELVVPISMSLAQGRSYWLAYSAESKKNDAFERFRVWLAKECAMK